MRTSASLAALLALLVPIAALTFGGCHGGVLADAPGTIASAPTQAPSQAPTQAPSPTPAAPTGPIATQVQYGARVFANSCARCHGAGGEGSSAAPALVGGRALPSRPRAGAALRKGTFRTAMDIGMFIKGNMPPGGPHHSMDELKAVLAYLLQSNGVRLTQPISPAVAGTIPWSR